MDPIQVAEADPRWSQLFAQLHDRLWPHVSDLAVAIEHVGSTSVAGLAAKPVLDVDVVLRSRGEQPAMIARLAELGYTHRGDLGIADREAFRASVNQPPHHLYVCPADSLALRNHLTLRDHLRANAADREAYARLKRQLAQQFPYDMDAYVEGKSEFILGILARAGFESDGLETIRQSNARSA